jgi:NDP-sugar pyrophosphorylase family protein
LKNYKVIINIENYISKFYELFPQENPWKIVQNLDEIILNEIKNLDENFEINNGIAIHKTAVVENNVTIKSPAIIGENCFLGANSYLRNGIYLDQNVKIGTCCEVKTSIIFENSAIAHFNYIGDSIIGKNVNFEAGSITANHYNERNNKRILVKIKTKIIDTNIEKFGALVGDDCKIGANAVLSPGTILEKKSIVKRLELIEQISE